MIPMHRSRNSRIPGARWFWSQGRALRDAAFADHARAVAEHHHSDDKESSTPTSGSVPAQHPVSGTTAEHSGGATAPARINPNR